MNIYPIIHDNDCHFFLFMKVFVGFGFETAYMKLMTLYIFKSNCTHVIFDFVSTILLHRCFIKQTI